MHIVKNFRNTLNLKIKKKVKSLLRTVLILIVHLNKAQ